MELEAFHRLYFTVYEEEISVLYIEEIKKFIKTIAFVPEDSKKFKKEISLVFERAIRQQNKLARIYLIEQESFEKALDIRNDDQVVEFIGLVHNWRKNPNRYDFQESYKNISIANALINFLDHIELKEGSFSQSIGAIAVIRSYDYINRDPEELSFCEELEWEIKPKLFYKWPNFCLRCVLALVSIEGKDSKLYSKSRQYSLEPKISFCIGRSYVNYHSLNTHNNLLN